MNDIEAYIEVVRRLNPSYQVLEIATENDALHTLKPGQTLLARLIDDNDDLTGWHPYLREHWWPSGFTSRNVLLVEQPFSQRYRPGQVLRLLGPVGTPYRFRPSLRNVLLLAYDSSPTPLTIMVRQLLHHNVSVTLVLLGQARQYNTDHLPAEVEVIHGDDHLHWDDMVMTMGWADQVFVTVNTDNEPLRFGEVLRTFQEKRIDVPKNYLFGIFTEILPCGMGACHACMLRIKGNLVPVCKDGPAFDLTQVQL